MNNKSIIFGILLLIFLSPLVSAELLDIKIIPVNDAVAKEFNMSAKFNMTITNNNDFADIIWIDTVLDMVISPNDFNIPAKSSLEIPIEINPSAYLKSKYSDVHSFSYFVKGYNSGTVNGVVDIKIVSLNDALKISIPATVRLSDRNLTLTLENKENMWITGKLSVDSDIFSGSKDVMIEPVSRQDIEIPVTIAKMKAGKFLITADFETSDYTLEKKEEIVLEPSTQIKTDESKTGSIFVYNHNVKKTNLGNIESDAVITISKTVFSSWFTTFSQVPDKTEIKGLMYVYSWTKNTDLDESFEITAKTDYSLPLTVLFMIAITFIVIAVYMQKQIIIRKRTVRVKTSTGGFALRVLLNVRCIRGEAREVIVTDFMPIFSRFYEKSASLQPDRKIGRAVTWFLGNMIKGEEKTISYVIYSEVKVVGKIELPVVKGSYRNKKGRLKQLSSNKIFILAEEMPHQE